MWVLLVWDELWIVFRQRLERAAFLHCRSFDSANFLVEDFSFFVEVVIVFAQLKMSVRQIWEITMVAIALRTILLFVGARGEQLPQFFNDGKLQGLQADDCHSSLSHYVGLMIGCR